jgi:hypothetical protein
VNASTIFETDTKTQAFVWCSISHFTNAASTACPCGVVASPMLAFLRTRLSGSRSCFASAPRDLENPDALKSSPVHFDRAGAVRTRLRICQIQVVWTPVNLGEHSKPEIHRFSGVEISIFARSRCEKRAPDAKIFF